MSSSEERAGRQQSYSGLPLRPDISLTSVRVEHAAAMYRWMCDPIVAGNLGLTREPTPERTLAWIQDLSDNPTLLAFAIQAGSAHIGNVVLDRIDRSLSIARFSIYIGEAHTRKRHAGFTASYLALAEGFHRLALEKIYLTVHAKHSAALSLYTGLGFVREGVLRGEFILDGQRLDRIYMGILRNEFLARVDQIPEGDPSA